MVRATQHSLPAWPFAPNGAAWSPAVCNTRYATSGWAATTRSLAATSGWPSRRPAMWPERDFPPPTGIGEGRLGGDVGHTNMTLQARPHALPLGVEESLRGVLALGLLEADGVSSDPLPPEFHAER